jgi:ankyrin repeat protein
MELDKVINGLKNNDLTSKEILEWKSEKSFNLWHCFAATNNVECFNKISSLVSKSKLVEKLSERNELGDLPVHLAALNSNLDILKTIVKATNTLDSLDAQNRNVAMICLRNKDKEVIDFTLNHTKNINQKDRRNHNLLDYSLTYSDSFYQKIMDLGCIPQEKEKAKLITPIAEDKEESILEFVQNNKKKIALN